MHAIQFLHNLIGKSSIKHQKRSNSLKRAVMTLLKGPTLTLTSLGRKMQDGGKPSSNICSIDRLLGNTKLYEERIDIYKNANSMLLGHMLQPQISVDWSGILPGGKIQLLRATVAVQGRSITVLENAYDLKNYNKPKVHKDFLAQLKAILPEGCIPIIVTDAGFTVPWFMAVEELGWDYVGRVRGRVCYRKTAEKSWETCVNLYETATIAASYIGEVMLSKKFPLATNFYLVRQKKKGRVKVNVSGKRSATSTSKKHERKESDPWLIATSISPKDWQPKEIMNIYKKRMQIEESFRDTKCMKYGFGLNASRTRCPKRMEILLLIAMLANLAAWLQGLAAITRGIARGFQAQRVKNKRVLSTVFIGCQTFLHKRIKFKKLELKQSLDELCKLIQNGVAA